jgi:hypothetical protein
MKETKLVISLEQRGQILKAAEAIQRQLEKIAARSDWQTRYVVGTNLFIIQASLTNLPRVNAN